MKTRGMQALMANRAASELVTLKYLTYEDSGDGSAVATAEEIECRASVGALQATEIERFEKAGILVRNGITVVIPEAPEGQPDTVSHYSKNYRVVDWSVKRENDNFTVVATCDEITIPAVDFSEPESES